ncbi:MAG: trigger factor [Coprobacillus sp.]|nr:trigger factor [Coprobacillus sp.]
METKVTKTDNTHLELEVEVDAEQWRGAQKKAFDKLAKDVEIKGFRKGKAPQNLVKEQISDSKVWNEAISSIINDLFVEAIKKEDVHPFASPDVMVTKCSNDELAMKFMVTTEPIIEIGPYKGLEVGKEEATVSDEEVEESLKKTQSENATLVIKEGKAELGDVVVIDAVGVLEGEEEPFEGGTVTNYELELGSQSFVPGFEEQLVGVEPDQHVDVAITFPEQYVENLAGKNAVFHTDVHEVKTKQLPELTDAFIEGLNHDGIKTVEQFREHTKQDLLQQKSNKLKSDYIGKVLDEIISHSSIDIPHEIIDQETDSMRESQEEQMAQSGFDLESYLQIVGQSEDEFMAQLRERATKNVTNFFILDKIGQIEDIVIEDADLEFEYAKMAEAYHMEIDQVREALASQVEQFRSQVRFTRIEDLLYREND